MAGRRNHVALAGRHATDHSWSRGGAKTDWNLPAGNHATGARIAFAWFPPHRLSELRPCRGALEVRVDGHPVSGKHHARLEFWTDRHDEDRTRVHATGICRHDAYRKPGV